MALFVLILLILNCFLQCLLGSETDSGYHILPYLKIVPSTQRGGQSASLFYKVDDTLNISCQLTTDADNDHSNIQLDWIIPQKTINSQHRVIQSHGEKFSNLIIERLQEYDAGEYKCRGVSNKEQKLLLDTSVRISVKKRKECSESMFQCLAGVCIHKRYTCDGFRDCKNGEDEANSLCGPGSPCDNKLLCPDNRCIPYDWCCDAGRDPNCTVKVKPSCCIQEKLMRETDLDVGSKYAEQRFSDMGFLQTTVYTVIGCAMAFMFIVTIIVIAICRVHVRRTLQSRCPGPGGRTPSSQGGRPGVHGPHMNGLSFYDHFDLYFNRPGVTSNDLMSVNPLLVTYNINNGVQFVGRPVDPPPYCEIVATPPREGPPPPYVSQENICVHHSRRSEPESTEVGIETEETELDALLGASCVQNISVISCNAIDVVSCEETNEVVADVTLLQEASEPSQHDNVSRSSDTSAHAHCHETAQPCCGALYKSNENLSSLDIIVLKSCDSLDEAKTQSGESSSIAPTSVSDISKGAIKRILDTSSCDTSSKTRKHSPKSC